MELSAEDDVFRQLVQIAKSKFKECLSILFVNHQLLPVFTIFPTKSVLGLIDIRGQVEKAEESISLAKSKFSLQVIPTIKDLSSIDSWMKQLEIFKSQLKPAILPELINRLVTHQLAKPLSLVEKTLVEGFIAFLFENFINLWRKQCKDISDVQLLIERLSQQGLVQSCLQVSVCTRCHGFELICGSHPLSDSPCPKCNAQRTYARVYLFDEQFNQCKMRDEDLPRFISRYIEDMSGSSIEAVPFKWFGPDTEVDVSIEDVIGIECKTFLRELPIGEEDLKSKTGKLTKKLQKYYNAKIKHVLVISSLLEYDTRLLETDLLRKLKDAKIMFESIKVIPGAVDSLLQALDSRIRELLRGPE